MRHAVNAAATMLLIAASPLLAQQQPVASPASLSVAASAEPGERAAPEIIFQALPEPLGFDPGATLDMTLAAPAGVALAQGGVAGSAGIAVPFELPLPGMPGAAGMNVLMTEPFELAKPIEGAPYSAEITTEVVQQLADGNRIERKSSSTVARDGRGRLRREQPIAAIGPLVPAADARMVTITDPVAGRHYSLDNARKVARSMPLPTLAAFGPAGAADTISIVNEAGVTQRTVVRGTAAAARSGSASATVPEPADVITTVRTEAMAQPGSPTTVTMARRINGGDTAASNATTESLGTRQVEGVGAEGSRTTVTIPAGSIGNQLPIEIVSERWFSSELGVVVLSRRSDPRFGETIYRLTNIVRAEPAAELFEVPADYTVETNRPMMIRP